MTASSAPDAIRFRPMQRSEADLERFHRCFVDNGFPRTLAHLRWQYFERTHEQLLVNFAVAGAGTEDVVGITAAIPALMRANGASVVAAQALDTLMHRDYRRQGLFLQMASALHDRAHNEGAALIYGFPNGNSAHGYFQRLSCQSLDPLTILMRPLRSGYVLRKMKAGALSPLFDFSIGALSAPRLERDFVFRTMSSPTAEFDAVWQTFAKTIPFALERTSEYLGWRLRRPGEAYEIIALYRNDALMGYAIIGSVVTSTGELAGKLLDVVFDPAHTSHAELLIAQSLHRLHERGCVVAWAWSLTHASGHAAYRSAGFLPMPESFRPTETHVGVRAFTSLNGVNDRTNWYVSMLDSDVD
ncbi:MAG: GNAT family N-acetyltransferase [Gemmatimonas sp.]